jgi:hypothetical protein
MSLEMTTPYKTVPTKEALKASSVTVLTGLDSTFIPQITDSKHAH